MSSPITSLNIVLTGLLLKETESRVEAMHPNIIIHFNFQDVMTACLFKKQGLEVTRVVA